MKRGKYKQSFITIAFMSVIWKHVHWLHVAKRFTIENAVI